GFKIKPSKKSKTSCPLDSHPQSRKIRTLWLEMASIRLVHNSSEQALAHWIKHETDIDDSGWIQAKPAALLKN
uniref:phage protein GemA/Gp16 family protein n=1 Tax=Photorhabdus sp. CRCIA-P01 TaxID=2019570 RepID=UPI001E5DA716